MIRRISLVILFASSTFALAQPLYKWVEADGSITFSPNKPAPGISFETVNKNSKSSTLESAAQQGAAPASSGLAPPVAATPPSSNQLQHAPAKTTVANSENRVQSSAANTSIVRANQSRQSGNSAVRMRGKPTPLAAAQTRSQTVAVSASNTKQRRCQDLRKRVVSLERRLKSRLTPEDMDNTVVHMARYQRSFDQHCVQ